MQQQQQTGQARVSTRGVHSAAGQVAGCSMLRHAWACPPQRALPPPRRAPSLPLTVRNASMNDGSVRECTAAMRARASCRRRVCERVLRRAYRCIHGHRGHAYAAAGAWLVSRRRGRRRGRRRHLLRACRRRSSRHHATAAGACTRHCGPVRQGACTSTPARTRAAGTACSMRAWHTSINSQCVCACTRVCCCCCCLLVRALRLQAAPPMAVRCLPAPHTGRPGANGPAPRRGAATKPSHGCAPGWRQRLSRPAIGAVRLGVALRKSRGGSPARSCIFAACCGQQRLTNALMPAAEACMRMGGRVAVYLASRSVDQQKSSGPDDRLPPSCCCCQTGNALELMGTAWSMPAGSSRSCPRSTRAAPPNEAE